MLDLMLAERRAFLDTVRGLSDEEFETGSTLCSQWAPRDVLAHVVGVDRELSRLWRTGPIASRFNAAVVAGAHVYSREELQARGARWAQDPPPIIRAMAWFLVGDVSVHHQDVLRGLGHHREVPPRIAAAILREGAVLGPHRLARHRLVPLDRPHPIGLHGRPTVTGTSEAIGMWLAGRSSVAAELTFGGAGRSARS